jgi:hypothetical protein
MALNTAFPRRLHPASPTIALVSDRRALQRMLNRGKFAVIIRNEQEIIACYEHLSAALDAAPFSEFPDHFTVHDLDVMLHPEAYD